MNVEKEIKQIDKAIAELVYPKNELQKAYNYYHSKRDADQFKYLEDNFGIGTPTGVEFNPLVRPHIDRLIGEYLSINPDVKITCKDADTISNIMRDKQLEIQTAQFKYLKQYLENHILASITSDQDTSVDPFIEKELQKITDNISSSYVSQYEVAAQNILDYFKQSKNIDLQDKMRSLLTDLCITGTCYYRVRPSNSGDNVQLEALNPLNTFVEKNPNSNCLADSYRSVVKRYLSVSDIIIEYGPYLKDEHIKILKNRTPELSSENSSVMYVNTSRVENSYGSCGTPGILGGLEVHPFWSGDEQYKNNERLWEVFDVEWLEIDYKTGKQTRHEGSRIGEEIYITKGESDFVIRTKDNPNRARLSVNGLFFLDKNGQPNSMIEKTMKLQDRFDILSFYETNLIANSGTKGDFIDVTMLPTFLGENTPERLQKWISYKKQGTALLDTSQEGMQGANLNTIFNGFDDTLRAESIQAIQLAKQAIQHQVSMITGVLPEALAQYEQRDAVSNVQLGVRTTMLMTKQIFNAMDSIYQEINYDMLNLAKLVWPKGKTGTIVLGMESKIFEALPEYYTVTDFDVHIEDSTKAYQDLQTLVSISGELIKGGAADLQDITNILTTKSVTQIKRYVDNAIARKKAENDQILQLQQQLQQADQQMKEMQKNLKQLQQQNQQLNSELEQNSKDKLQLEMQKLQLEKEKIKNQKDYNDKVIDTKNKQIQAQVAEMFDGNPYNDKIKSIV